MLNDTVLYQNGHENEKSSYSYTNRSNYTNISYSFAFFEPHFPFWVDNFFMSFVAIFIFAILLSAFLSSNLSKPFYRMYFTRNNRYFHQASLLLYQSMSRAACTMNSAEGKRRRRRFRLTGHSLKESFPDLPVEILRGMDTK